MTALSTSAIITQAAVGSPAGIQAWSGELFGELLACGLTQTQDSGQLILTGSGATAVTNATQPASTGPLSQYMIFTFNDTLAQGGISTTALVAGGTGGTNGTYTALVVTGVTSGATSARASVTVASGIAGNMTITTAGSGYIAGEKLTVSNANIPTAAAWMPTALSSGAPVVFRVDIGGSASVTAPAIWVTLGQGSNGSGTITGSAGTSKMTQVICGIGNAPASIVTAYPSYYCYNSATGTCLIAMKFGAATSAFIMGFYIHRSNNSAGAPTGTSVSLYSNGVSTSPSSTSFQTGAQQTLAYATNIVYPTISTGTSPQWPAIPQSATGSQVYGLTSTLENSDVFIFNTFYFNPGFNYSAFMGMALNADIANGTTVATTMIGTEAVTLISLTGLFGVQAAPLQLSGVNTLAVFS